MKSVKNEVKQLIDKLNDRFNNLPEGAVHPMDADLMLAMLRQLYEKVEVLRDLKPAEIPEKTDPIQYTGPGIVINESVEKPVEIQPVAPVLVPQPEVTVAAVNIPDPGLIIEQKEETSIVPEISAPIKNEFHAGNEFARDPGPLVSKPLPPQADLFAAPSLADMLKSDSPSLNDRITSGRHDQTLADRIQLKPISDLKAAIGINEKFQFLNDLFESSSDRYNEAIQLLNACSNSNEANQLFDDLKSRYGWDEQGPAFKRLHEFVVRRYLAIRN